MSSSLPSKAASDALVMDYLVSGGFAEAAVSFASEAGLAPPAGLEGVRRRAAVRAAMVAGDVDAVVDMVNDLDPELLESNAALCLALQRRRFVEAALRGDLERALELANECLAPLAEEQPEDLEELEKTLSLLLFERPADSPVADLADPAARPLEAARLNAAMLTHLGLPHSSRVEQLAPLARWILARVAELSPVVVEEDDEDGRGTKTGGGAGRAREGRGTSAGGAPEGTAGTAAPTPALATRTPASGAGTPLGPRGGVGIARAGTGVPRAVLGRELGRGTGWGV